MSLFEWLGESSDPGPTGTYDAGARRRNQRSHASIFVNFGLAALLLGLWIYVGLVVWEARTATEIALFVLGTVLYLFLGYSVHPKPDTSNMGWAGGLIDHPFRISDDFNRGMVAIKLVLWPGRFVSESLVDMFRLGSREMQ